MKRKRTSWKERKSQGTLCSFLGCSAKTQYVYVILEAVNFVLKEQQLQKELMVDLKRENSKIKHTINKRQALIDRHYLESARQSMTSNEIMIEVPPESVLGSDNISS